MDQSVPPPPFSSIKEILFKSQYWDSDYDEDDPNIPEVDPNLPVVQAAEAELSRLLRETGLELSHLGWDYYDNSLEIYGVPAAARLSPEAQRLAFDAGFNTVYVNHTDHWETHYNFDHRKGFKPDPGWRVSYPQNRSGQEGGIWVEKQPSSWPADWFRTGYAKVKSLLSKS